MELPDHMARKSSILLDILDFLLLFFENLDCRRPWSASEKSVVKRQNLVSDWLFSASFYLMAQKDHSAQRCQGEIRSKMAREQCYSMQVGTDSAKGYASSYIFHSRRYGFSSTELKNGVQEDLRS